MMSSLVGLCIQYGLIQIEIKLRSMMIAIHATHILRNVRYSLRK